MHKRNLLAILLFTGFITYCCEEKDSLNLYNQVIEHNLLQRNFPKGEIFLNVAGNGKSMYSGAELYGTFSTTDTAGNEIPGIMGVLEQSGKILQDNIIKKIEQGTVINSENFGRISLTDRFEKYASSVNGNTYDRSYFTRQLTKCALQTFGIMTGDSGWCYSVGWRDYTTGLIDCDPQLKAEFESLLPENSCISADRWRSRACLFGDKVAVGAFSLIKKDIVGIQAKVSLKISDLEAKLGYRLNKNEIKKFWMRLDAHSYLYVDHHEDVRIRVILPLEAAIKIIKEMGTGQDTTTVEDSLKEDNIDFLLQENQGQSVIINSDKCVVLNVTDDILQKHNEIREVLNLPAKKTLEEQSLIKIELAGEVLKNLNQEKINSKEDIKENVVIPLKVIADFIKEKSIYASGQDLVKLLINLIKEYLLNINKTSSIVSQEHVKIL